MKKLTKFKWFLIVIATYSVFTLASYYPYRVFDIGHITYNELIWAHLGNEYSQENLYIMYTLAYAASKQLAKKELYEKESNYWKKRLKNR